MPKTQMEQHTLVVDNTLLNNHTCYSIIPCTKWHGRLYCRLYSSVSQPGFCRTSLRVPWEIVE